MYSAPNGEVVAVIEALEYCRLRRILPHDETHFWADMELAVAMAASLGTDDLLRALHHHATSVAWS